MTIRVRYYTRDTVHEREIPGDALAVFSQDGLVSVQDFNGGVYEFRFAVPLRNLISVEKDEVE